MQNSTRRCSSSQCIGEIYTMPVPFSLATKRRAQKWHTVPEATASPANRTGFHHVYDAVRSAPAIGLPEKYQRRSTLPDNQLPIKAPNANGTLRWHEKWCLGYAQVKAKYIPNLSPISESFLASPASIGPCTLMSVQELDLDRDWNLSPYKHQGRTRIRMWKEYSRRHFSQLRSKKWE